MVKGAKKNKAGTCVLTENKTFRVGACRTQAQKDADKARRGGKPKKRSNASKKKYVRPKKYGKGTAEAYWCDPSRINKRKKKSSKYTYCELMRLRRGKPKPPPSILENAYYGSSGIGVPVVNVVAQ